MDQTAKKGDLETPNTSSPPYLFLPFPLQAAWGTRSDRAPAKCGWDKGEVPATWARHAISPAHVPKRQMSVEPSTPPLYRDHNVVVYPSHVELLAYWFPIARKRNLKNEEVTRVLHGKAKWNAAKTWGSGLDFCTSRTPIWWHWDGLRIREGSPAVIFETSDTKWRHGCTPRGGEQAVIELLAVLRKTLPKSVEFVEYT